MEKKFSELEIGDYFMLDLNSFKVYCLKEKLTGDDGVVYYLAKDQVGMVIVVFGVPMEKRWFEKHT